MKVKPLSPEKIAEEVKKLIEAKKMNVDLIIKGINDALVTQHAQYPKGFLKERTFTIHSSDIRRPNKNWSIQSQKAANSALQEFKKHWNVAKIGKWGDSFCHIEFTPKK
ncbi:MAG: hypothetical protein WC606_02210 [Candidatus Absconditabacterales bacterium]|jgi:hypothetical protein